MNYSKETIAKVYASYFGASVDLSTTEWYKLETKERGRFIEATLVGVNSNEESVGACIKHNIVTQNNGLQFLDFSAFKLILKPLSSITKEDAVEVCKIYGHENGEVIIHPKGKDLTIIEFKRAEYDSEYFWLSLTDNKWNVFVYQYLQSKGYDLPQLLLDGKTLYEAGLALRPLNELTKEHMMEIAEHLNYDARYLDKSFLFEQSKKLANIEIELSVRGYEIQTLHKLHKFDNTNVFKLKKIGDNYWLQNFIFFIACSDEEKVVGDLKYKLHLEQIEKLIGDSKEKNEWEVEVEMKIPVQVRTVGKEVYREIKINNGYVNILKIK